MTQELDDLLQTRKTTHGEFTHHARVASLIKDVFLDEITARVVRGQPPLSLVQRESLDMIAHKIGRIIAGDPNFRDHWDDIAGYAKLAADRCKPEAPQNGADTLGLNKPACHCSDDCMAEKGAPPKYVYCKKAESAVL